MYKSICSKLFFVLPAISVFVLSQAQASLIFFDDFESGQFDEWDAPYSQYSTFETKVELSTMAAHGAAAGAGWSFWPQDASPTMRTAALYKYFTLTDYYCRFYINFPSGFFSQLADGQDRVITQFMGANGTYTRLSAGKASQRARRAPW